LILRNLVERRDLIGGQLHGVCEHRLVPPVGGRKHGQRAGHAAAIRRVCSAVSATATSAVRRLVVIVACARGDKNGENSEDGYASHESSNYQALRDSSAAVESRRMRIQNGDARDASPH